MEDNPAAQAAALSTGRKLGLAASGVFLLTLFLPWISMKNPFLGSASGGAPIESWQGILALIFGLLAAAWFLTGREGALHKALPAEVRNLMPIVPAVLALLIAPVWFLFDSKTGAENEFIREFAGVSRTLWSFLSLAAGIAAVIASVMVRSDD